MLDRPALNRLIDQSVRRLMNTDYSAEQLESAMLHTLGLDPQLIEDGTYFVAEIDGQIVGCGGWSRRKAIYGNHRARRASAKDDFLTPPQDAARIRAFYVHPDWARRGIGRRLLQQCEVAARAAGFVRLELIATLSGVPLYNAYGFVTHEPVNLPLPNGLVFPTIRMTKRIN
jgi:GNAT superfamily N-acetyltransferase